MIERSLKDWLTHRRVLEELLKTVKDTDVNFKPWDGAMTLGQLALHIAGWADTFITLTKTGEFSKPENMNYTTMTEVREAVHELTEKTVTTYSSLIPEDLEAVRTFPISNFQLPGKVYLKIIYDHEVHHKGQLYIYARMTGVEKVPFFRA
ncbi:MAG TPA: DinB family protein [Bacillus sp. (in: firmicutes)]|nr:DinB family protein [Bacillus sp. (in: firmicutes)]